MQIIQMGFKLSLIIHFCLLLEIGNKIGSH